MAHGGNTITSDGVNAVIRWRSEGMLTRNNVVFRDIRLHTYYSALLH
jgi:hypothetical protein